MEDTNTQDDGRQPLWKQLLGAVIGGGLALALYYGYEYAQPKVAAYLTLPPADRMYDLGSSHIADKTTDEGNRKRLLSRNARVAQQMQNQNDDILNTVDDHSLDIAWPGHDPKNPKYTEVTGMPAEPEHSEMEMDMVMMEDDMMHTDEPKEIVVNNNLFAQEVATKEMMAQSDWDSLWGNIADREADEHIERSNADGLSDTGFGVGVIIAGATGGALAGVRRKRKMPKA